MLIFVYEFLWGGGLNSAAPSASLQREGWAMLNAALSDFARCPGINVVTMLDAALPVCAAHWPSVQTIRVEAGTEQQHFVELARQADYTLVIAPEFEELLLERCLWVKECGGRLLGPAIEAIRLTADKLRLATHLQERGLPTPAAQPWRWLNPVTSFPSVVKPRFGAGSQSTYLLRQQSEVAGAHRSEQGQQACEMIVQPYCEGFAASVSFLCGPEVTLALPAAAQQLSQDGRFRYLGGSLPLPADQNARAQRLARRAIEAVEGLRGYVGVDLVLGAVPDGSADMVLEINPRLTTSYVGLRCLAQFNLAQALLAVATGASPPSLTWRRGSVRFDAGGIVEMVDQVE